VKQMRLTRVQVLIVGGALAIAIGVVFFLALIRPQRAAIKQTTADAQYNRDEVSKRGPQAKRDLEQAQQREAVVTARFDQIMKTRMPEVDLSDPIAGMIRLWRLPREEGTLLDRWFRSIGALSVSGYSFPAFPSQRADPSLRVLPPLNWTLTFQVRNFPELLELLPKLTKAPRFMVMHSVTVAGPRDPGQPLTATIPVTLYEWTKAAEPKAVAAVAAGAEGAGAEGAGFGAGPMGGGPGMGRGGMRGGGPRGGMRGGPMGGGMRGGGRGMGQGMRGGGG